jgi:hypothetical protein
MQVEREMRAAIRTDARYYEVVIGLRSSRSESAKSTRSVGPSHKSHYDEEDANTVLVDRRARRFLGMDTAATEAEINGVKVKIVGSFSLGPDFVSDGTVIMSDRTFATLALARIAPRLNWSNFFRVFLAKRPRLEMSIASS